MNQWCTGIYADRYIQWITDVQESMQTDIFNESPTHRNLCRYIQWITDAQESMHTDIYNESLMHRNLCTYIFNEPLMHSNLCRQIYSMNHWCIAIYADRNIQRIMDVKESTQTEIFNESFLRRNPQADIFNESLLHRNQHRQKYS